jgi:hypothetical protein
MLNIYCYFAYLEKNNIQPLKIKCFLVLTTRFCSSFVHFTLLHHHPWSVNRKCSSVVNFKVSIIKLSLLINYEASCDKLYESRIQSFIPCWSTCRYRFRPTPKKCVALLVVFFIVAQRSSRCPYTLLLIELPTNVRIFCLSCNVKNPKTTAKLFKKSRNKRRSSVIFYGVICEVCAYTITVSWFSLNSQWHWPENILPYMVVFLVPGSCRATIRNSNSVPGKG